MQFTKPDYSTFQIPYREKFNKSSKNQGGCSIITKSNSFFPKIFLKEKDQKNEKKVEAGLAKETLEVSEAKLKPLKCFKIAKITHPNLESKLDQKSLVKRSPSNRKVIYSEKLKRVVKSNLFLQASNNLPEKALILFQRNKKINNFIKEKSLLIFEFLKKTRYYELNKKKEVNKKKLKIENFDKKISDLIQKMSSKNKACLNILEEPTAPELFATFEFSFRDKLEPKKISNLSYMIKRGECIRRRVERKAELRMIRQNKKSQFSKKSKISNKITKKTKLNGGQKKILKKVQNGKKVKRSRFHKKVDVKESIITKNGKVNPSNKKSSQNMDLCLLKTSLISDTESGHNIIPVSLSDGDWSLPIFSKKKKFEINTVGKNFLILDKETLKSDMEYSIDDWAKFFTEYKIRDTPICTFNESA